MSEIRVSDYSPIHIGYEGEKNVTKIIFPYDNDWLECGDGEFKVRVLRNKEHEAYNATDIINDTENNSVVMTVTDIELSVRGQGEMQLCYICGDKIKKSRIYHYIVDRAIDCEVVDPPHGSIINEIVTSLAELTDRVAILSAAVGDLSELDTDSKDDLVSAINEVRENSGTQIDVDSELSSVSENPVQNKVITNALNLKADGSAVYTKAQVDTALNGKAGTAVATSSTNGLMSAQDKTTLDAVTEDYSSALLALGVIDNG